MANRRTFLKEAGAATVLAPFVAPRLPSSFISTASAEKTATPQAPDHIGFKPHWIKQGDGKGGWVLRPAEIQFLHYGDGKTPYYTTKGMGVKGYGLAQMDNGEVILLGSYHDGSAPSGQNEKSVVAFSRDGGRSWTPLKVIENVEGRPVNLAYLGKGDLMFQSQLAAPVKYFSSDYGRTWKGEPFQLAPDGQPFMGEGSLTVDRDPQGAAVRIGQLGCAWGEKAERAWPEEPTVEFLRWSTDGGRTWTHETTPEHWRWKEEYQGKTYTRGVSEGSLIRATNGWLVAALRTDMPAKFIPFRNDNAEGIGISISKDDGKTWSPMQKLFEGGRMHPCFLRLADNDLVMTYVMRQDIQQGRLASYRRGVEALISYNNGLTWEMARRYILDDFEFADGTPLALACGHNQSTLLDDGYILTTYGHYPSKGAALIRWKPSSAKA